MFRSGRRGLIGMRGAKVDAGNPAVYPWEEDPSISYWMQDGPARQQCELISPIRDYRAGKASCRIDQGGRIFGMFSHNGKWDSRSISTCFRDCQDIYRTSEGEPVVYHSLIAQHLFVLRIGSLCSPYLAPSSCRLLGRNRLRFLLKL